MAITEKEWSKYENQIIDLQAFLEVNANEVMYLTDLSKEELKKIYDALDKLVIAMR